MGWELSNVFGNLVEKQGSISMKVHFGNSFDGNNVRMKDGDFFLQLQRYWNVCLFDVLIRLEQNVMRLLVGSFFLLFGSNGDGDFGCVFIVLQNSIKLVSVNGVFGLTVSFTHQVIQKFLDQVLLRGISLNQLNHVLNVSLAGLDPKFKRFHWVFCLLVLLGCFVPLAFSFKVLGNRVSLFNSALS